MKRRPNKLFTTAMFIVKGESTWSTFLKLYTIEKKKPIAGYRRVIIGIRFWRFISRFWLSWFTTNITKDICKFNRVVLCQHCKKRLFLIDRRLARGNQGHFLLESFWCFFTRIVFLGGDSCAEGPAIQYLNGFAWLKFL